MSFWPKSVKARRRLTLFLIAAPVFAAAVALSLYALRGTVVYFYTPAQLIAAHVAPGKTVRLGGLVKPGTVIHAADGSVSFVVEDKLGALGVSYRGDLPDLFREGQGVVCEGVMQAGGSLRATQVLAKHDEKYIPKNVEEALKKQGEWRPDSGIGASSAAAKPFGAS